MVFILLVITTAVHLVNVNVLVVLEDVVVTALELVVVTADKDVLLLAP